MATRQQDPGLDEGLVVAKAVQRAAGLLQLSQQEMAGILGVSASTMSRVAKGSASLSPQSADGKLALLFLRVFRSLDTLVGGQAAQARAWLVAENVHLGGVPLARLRTPEGLVRVADHLDAMRGKL